MAIESVPLTPEQKDRLGELIANASSLADLLHSAGESDANVPGQTLAQVSWQIRSQLHEIHVLLEQCGLEVGL